MYGFPSYTLVSETSNTIRITHSGLVPSKLFKSLQRNRYVLVGGQFQHSDTGDLRRHLDLKAEARMKVARSNLRLGKVQEYLPASCGTSQFHG
jgi:hypothetical protein